MNQLHNGLMKLEFDISTIYKYIDALSNKIITPTLVNPIDLKTKLTII